MFDLFLREIKEVILKIFVKITPSFIHPNIVTIISLFMGLLCAYECAFSKNIGLQILYWAMNRILDGYDGVLARARNQ